MRQTQPNFEKIKCIIFNKAINDEKILISLLNGKRDGGFHEKKEQFKKDLNDFLDQMDIRAVGSLTNEIKRLLPKWFRDRKYVIDYNKSNILDFIIVKN